LIGFSGLIFFKCLLIFLSPFEGDEAVANTMQQIGAARAVGEHMVRTEEGKGLISVKLS
jgi:hypothetical protein